MRITSHAILLAAVTSILALASSASATPVITSIGADLAASPYTFTYQGSSFTFGYNGQLFSGPVTISTANGGEVNTIFGQPTTNFADGRGGPVTFGPTQNYGAFADQTVIRFSNGGNFIGLRAVTGTGTFYGFAYSTDNILNSIGFENVADTAITATTAAGAVPEPASWALMIAGFGLVGGAMRRRAAVWTTVRYA